MLPTFEDCDLHRHSGCADGPCTPWTTFWVTRPWPCVPPLFPRLNFPRFSAEWRFQNNSLTLISNYQNLLYLLILPYQHSINKQFLSFSPPIFPSGNSRVSLFHCSIPILSFSVVLFSLYPFSSYPLTPWRLLLKCLQSPWWHPRAPLSQAV